MTYTEIIEKAKEEFRDVDNFAYHSSGKIKEVGDWKYVDGYGGENSGTDWHTVYYFPDHDVYIRIDGVYQSYEGTDFWNGWDSCREVRPKEKTITVYE